MFTRFVLQINFVQTAHKQGFNPAVMIDSNADVAERERGIKMDKSRIKVILEQYDAIIHKEEKFNIEFWYARELMPLLGYERWENFEKAVSRAMNSCDASGINVSEDIKKLERRVKTQEKKIATQSGILPD